MIATFRAEDLSEVFTPSLKSTRILPNLVE